ncbi:MAG: type VI immunity family protein [Cellvibrionaceae bacterium]
MSTATVFLPPDKVTEFIDESQKAGSQYRYKNNGYELGISSYITFYIYHDFDDHLSISKKMIQLYEEFQELTGYPFQHVWKNDTQVWLKSGDKRLPDDLYAVAVEMDKKERMFWIRATDKDSAAASPTWSFSSATSDVPDIEYTTLKMLFSYQWYQQHKQQWHKFVEHCFELLQPEQCYSGFEVGNGNLTVMNSYEAGTMERICADFYYGMDIDHPSTMAYQNYDNEKGYVNKAKLGAGIRTPTWCFMLSPYWLNKLNKSEEEVRDQLNHPDISITAFPRPKSKHNPNGVNALWIQLGELDLYPVGKGKPELLVQASRFIKPIRCDELALSSLDAWDDDPNPRFDYHSAKVWMQRFDDDIDWLRHRSRLSPLPSGVYEAKPGETVPQAGWWYAPELGEKTEPRYFEKGQQLPFDQQNEEGDEIIWYRRLDDE